MGATAFVGRRGSLGSGRANRAESGAGGLLGVLPRAQIDHEAGRGVRLVGESTQVLTHELFRLDRVEDEAQRDGRLQPDGLAAGCRVVTGPGEREGLVAAKLRRGDDLEVAEQAIGEGDGGDVGAVLELCHGCSLRSGSSGGPDESLT